MSFLLRLFLLSWFPQCLASFHFPCAGFSSRSAFTQEVLPSWASAVLASAPRARAGVVSARLNLSHSTIYVKGVFNFLGSVSLRQKFGATDRQVLQPCVNFLRETSALAPHNLFSGPVL